METSRMMIFDKQKQKLYKQNCFCYVKMSKVITFSKECVNDMDLTDLLPFVEWTDSKEYLTKDAGQEHYKLLSYLSNQLSDGYPVYDIGTYRGLSALALSLNSTQKVVSYDVKDWFPDDEVCCARKKSNIELRLMDCCNEMDEISKASLVVLDIDPHDGVQDKIIVTHLSECGFKGILVIDDILLNQNMKDFFSWVKSLPGVVTYDVTEYGHWSGTGLAVFDVDRFNIVLKN